ncbi:hypothetical protein CBR_g41787 [Chara braunii]|uniref:Homeobox domain-containing protein n=1 Tax=Chara braunii TaxID=69332 RepID=A0A388LWU1_CHABU|nr:hypothetical protein CBR_g41787 [Chara braunii]|eukprot:GBG86723.1 hypothetical protein CBR_g41787 [Chara braunii]
MAAKLALQSRVAGCLAISGVAGHDRELTCRQLGGRASGRTSGPGSGRSRLARWPSSVPCPDPDSTASAFFSDSSFSVRSQFARHTWCSPESGVGLWRMQICDERSGRRRWLRPTSTILLGHFSCLPIERAGKRESLSSGPLTPRNEWIRQMSSEGDECRQAMCRAAPQQRGSERRARRRQRKPKDAGGGVAAPSRKQQEQQVEREEHDKAEEEEEDGEWDISEEEFEKLFDELEMELQQGVRKGEYTEADLGDLDIDEEELRQFAREFGEEEGVSAEYAENESEPDEDDGADGDEETEESEEVEVDEDENRRGSDAQEVANASLGKEWGDLTAGSRTAAPRRSTTSASSVDAQGDESTDEGDNFHDDDDDDGDDGDDLVSMEEDLEGPEAVRTVHLEPWQVKRLAKALDKGRRHVNDAMVMNLVELTHLPRKEILSWFSARRESEQSHNGGRTLGDLQAFVPDSFRPKT